MKKQFLEAGKIVNTHGTRGEIKIDPWTDSPDFLCGLSTLYVDERPMRILSARAHKNAVIALLDGIDDINKAMPLKGKTVYINRSDITLPDGHFFLQDLMGIKVIEADSGEEVGTLKDILYLPNSNVYVVSGKTEHMIPAVDEFIVETNIEEDVMKVRLIDGM